MPILACLRVSSTDQNLARQEEMAANMGVEPAFVDDFGID